MEVDLKGLQLWRNHIATVPVEQINMLRFRAGQKLKPECDSIGCIVGHCASLYTLDELPRYKGKKEINFGRVAELIGISSFDGLWDFLFDEDWGNYKNVNAKEDALNRMDYVLKHGVEPKIWDFGRKIF